MTLVRMDKLLERAEARHVGCGAFNVGNMEMVIGAVRAAEEMNTPIILQIAERRLKHSPLELLGPLMVQAAIKSSVDIAVHFDHGRSLENIRRALELGFTSVMFDGSSLSLEENIKGTKAVSLMTDEFGACLEGELGIVGGIDGEGAKLLNVYTEPNEVLKYCQAVKLDALAIAIGNAHGNYMREPELDFGILNEIYDSVDVPLVLHGGSGLSDDNLRKAIRHGVRKMNIATASFQELTKSVSIYILNSVNSNYCGLNEAMVNGVYNNVKKHIRIFNGI